MRASGNKGGLDTFTAVISACLPDTAHSVNRHIFFAVVLLPVHHKGAIQEQSGATGDGDTILEYILMSSKQQKKATEGYSPSPHGKGSASMTSLFRIVAMFP